jgi:hypothetical protein
VLKLASAWSGPRVRTSTMMMMMMMMMMLIMMMMIPHRGAVVHGEEGQVEHLEQGRRVEAGVRVVRIAREDLIERPQRGHKRSLVRLRDRLPIVGAFNRG